MLNWYVRLAGCFGLTLHVALSHSTVWTDADGDAKQILDRSGISAGFVVHLGAGDGELTAALRRNDATQVHGLQRDPSMVAATRKRVQSTGHYGDVAIDVLDGEVVCFGK